MKPFIKPIHFLRKKPLLLAFSTMLTTALVGCGGGGSNPDAPQASSSATIQSDQVIGRIQAVDTQSNEVTINQTNYPLEGVDIRYQEQNIDANALTPGMAVVYNTQDKQIQLNPNISGVVENLAYSTDSVTFTVNKIALTSSQSLIDIENGDSVLVHYEAQADGSNKVISLIEIDQEGFNHYEIEGLITDVNAAQKQLVLGSTTINYANARIEDGVIAVGRFAEIFGRFNTDNTFEASVIEIENVEKLADKIEFEGTISWVNKEQTLFEINSRYQVSINANTRFEDGLKSNLVVGQAVEVDTKLQNEIRVATEVDFETPLVSSNQGTTAGTTTGTAVSSAFQVEGAMNYTNNRIQFNGFEFVVDSSTVFEDRLSKETLNSQKIQLEGIERAGVYYVREIEKADNDYEIDLEGTVKNNSLWGYTSSDQTLNAFNEQNVELECQISNDNTLYNCTRD